MLISEPSCHYCKEPLVPKLPNKAIYIGFRDGDMNVNVCGICKPYHYKAKAKTEHRGKFTEMPIMVEAEFQETTAESNFTGQGKKEFPEVKPEKATPAAFRFNEYNVCVNPEEIKVWNDKKYLCVIKVAERNGFWYYGHEFTKKGISEGSGGSLSPVSTHNEMVVHESFENKSGAIHKAALLGLEFFDRKKGPKSLIDKLNELIKTNPEGDSCRDYSLQKDIKIRKVLPPKPKTTTPYVQPELFPETKPRTIGYPGNKYARDAYKLLINLLPPHNHFISGFLGTCAVLANKKPATIEDIGIEINFSEVKPFWATHAGSKKIIEGDFLDIIKDDFHPLQQLFKQPQTLVYLDPPYRLSSRRSGKSIYKNELSDENHEQLLEWAIKQKCKIIISHYRDSLYTEMLQGWYTYQYESMTHQGAATEVIWCNYPLPERLHEYTWYGNNNTERQMFKRKIERYKNKFSNLPPAERHALLETLNSIV